MKDYDLPCFDGRKSFYGKARVIDDSEGNHLLKSYNTFVCILRTDGMLIKLSPVATQTTRRHVRSFFALFDRTYPGNQAWDELPLDTPVPLTAKGGAAV